jgi:hypothetical protein
MAEICGQLCTIYSAICDVDGGPTLYCARVTTQREVIKGNSSGVCFLTEAQAMAKDSVFMSTNTFPVTSWDEHTLTAATEFYADQNGDQTTKSSPGATKFVFRIVLNFETHQMTKFVETSTGKPTDTIWWEEYSMKKLQ